jgi:threonine synthase
MERAANKLSATARRAGWMLNCPVCRYEEDIDGGVEGCPICKAAGRTSAMIVHYGTLPSYSDLPKRGVGIWESWGAWLPDAPPEQRLTLGEGNTPLLRVQALCDLTGLSNLYLKMEAQNPSGAHKDRFHSVAGATAAATGKRGMIAFSTGNHGLSMTAYAAAHGLRSIVFSNERMPVLLQRAIRFAGGLPLITDHQTGNAIFETLMASDEWMPAFTLWPMPFSAPLGVEGYKTIAYEIYRDLGERMADRIYIPTAGGDLLAGIWRGQCELARGGQKNISGRLVACQPTGAAPLVTAFDAGADEITYLENAHSFALSIADPITGRMALDAVRATNGDAVAVTDAEIYAAGRLLASYGLFVEPSSAAPVAAVIKQARLKPELHAEKIVCVLTSSALKWLEAYGAASAEIGIQAGSVEAGRRAIDTYVNSGGAT